MVEKEAAVDAAAESGHSTHTLSTGIPADERRVGLILTTSIFALPLALAVFPQRQAVDAMKLEECFWERGGKDGKVEFNRGI